MARKKKATTASSEGKKNSLKNRQKQTLTGIFLVFFALFLFFSFSSFLIHWKEDQSHLSAPFERASEIQNLLGKTGAVISNIFIYKGFGIASYILLFLLFASGIYLLLNISLKKLRYIWFWGILWMIWFSVLLAFVAKNQPLLGGVAGFEINYFLRTLIGNTGIVLLLFFVLAVYVIFQFKVTFETVVSLFKKNEKAKTDAQLTDNPLYTEKKPQSKKHTPELQIEELPGSPEAETTDTTEDDFTITVPEEETIPDEPLFEIGETSQKAESAERQNPPEQNAKKPMEHISDEERSDALVEKYGVFDPTLELSGFKSPGLNLLGEHSNESITIDQEELEVNKNKIVRTLNNYNIEISKIKATIGPTVTLYEIVPAAGVRISKIKNLEDDIALSLSALGIRIIAPIPGKGTIGIEVPNKNPTLVSMRSVLASPKYQNARMELPCALGKTISNETYVVDLAKMPHLLMAGATGQGKSVGLNAILTSLIYKKHPSEVKFVLVDPKKVELTLFNKIERHYLAKLPDSEEAIITDTTKVIHTLNSLCIEMDQRYEMLKNAMVRNIKEYNARFKARRLNPDNGHRFLPYIVLVIDEFADLIMTSGKEVEMPIARLAQLARAVGIHLIVATQRPSVNVITGLIKANFPARIAFRVTSKIDSRTILDGPGADQLIGKGDMLFSGGSDLIRLQCAFVDTPDVEKITDYIGSQKAFHEAHLLPEYVGEEGSGAIDVDIGDRDPMFEDAARIIVIAQQGSASLLQRKLKLGYNRAGRLIDQMEAAGIVGPFEGSKARAVLIPDEYALEQLLNNEKKN